jgi:hypothetical protein
VTDGIREQIQAHANEHWDGDLITDWVIIAATIDSDGNTGIGSIPSREPMPAYILKGLLTEALDYARDGVFDFGGEDDD